MFHCKYIYIVNASFNAIYKDKGLDLTKLNTNFIKESRQYFYHIGCIDHNLKRSDWSNIVSFSSPTSIAGSIIPTEFKLEQNFPNPFNPTTAYFFHWPKQINVAIPNINVLL